MSNVVGTCDITFGSGGSGPKNVTIETKDYCTGLILPSASVAITGPGGYSYSGTSDVNGRLALGILQPGAYSMIVTAAGYLNSGDDLLANDGFTV